MKFIDNLSVKNKLIVVYILCVLIPMIITNWIILSIISSNIYSQKLKELESSYDKVCIQFEDSINQCIKFINLISSDPEFNNALSVEYANTSEYFDVYNKFLRNYFNTYNIAFPQIQATDIFVENKTIVRGGNFRIIDDEAANTEWYQKVIENNPSRVYIIKSEDKVISLIKNNTWGNKNGYLVKVDLNRDFFNDILIREFDNAQVYITDQDGQVILSNISNFNENNYFYNDIPEQKSMIKFEKSISKVIEETAWNITILSPKPTAVSWNTFNATNTNYALILFNLLLPTIVIIFISRSINTRLKLLTKHIKKIENQNFELELVEQNISRDEIGQLIKAFNSMVSKINQLIKDVYEANIQKKNIEIEKRQAEINALQSQINPHFLFNCLTTIKMRSLIKGEKETAQIIDNLAKLFRTTLSWERDMITIKEELAFIKNYLEIEKYRMGNDLKYSIFVDKYAEDCKIPKMALTTFVENACVHGIQNNEGYGFISVEVLFFGEYIQCIIADNGIGISEEKIKDIKMYLENKEKINENIGMKNVISRLSLYFGDKFEYNIFSKPNQGVRVWIKIPAVIG